MARVFSASRLRFLFKREEVTPRALALEFSTQYTLTGAGLVSIEKHLSGRAKPDVNLLAAYADYFGVPVDFFFEQH